MSLNYSNLMIKAIIKKNIITVYIKFLMQKKFLEINNICFAEPKGQPIKIIERPKEIIEE